MSREMSRPSAAEDQALVEALGQAARGVADANGAAEPSPRAWHELVRDRAAPSRRRWSNGWLLVAAGAVGLVVAFGIDGVVRRGLLSRPLTFSVDGGVPGPGGDIQAEGGGGSDVVFSDGTEVTDWATFCLADGSVTPACEVRVPTSQWLKFEPWNSVTRNATTTREITPSFHQTIGVLARANARMPIMLTKQKIAISTTATA